MPTLSRKPRRDRPVESVSLRIRFRADSVTAKRIKESIPSAVVRNGRCEVSIEGEAPSDVAAGAREVLEKIKQAIPRERL